MTSLQKYNIVSGFNADKIRMIFKNYSNTSPSVQPPWLLWVLKKRRKCHINLGTPIWARCKIKKSGRKQTESWEKLYIYVFTLLNTPDTVHFVTATMESTISYARSVTFATLTR